jgi:hypothetical protein
MGTSRDSNREGIPNIGGKADPVAEPKKRRKTAAGGEGATSNPGASTAGGTTGTGTGGTGGKTTGGEAPQGTPELVVLDPEKIPAQDNKPKKKKKKPSKKDVQMGELQQNIQVLLLGGFELLSKRAGSHWAISVEESEKIAEPLTRILDRMEVSEKLAAYSDYITLTAAVGITVLPRMMVSAEMKKQSQPRQVQGVKPVEKETPGSDRQDTGGDIPGLKAIITDSIPSLS